MRQKKWDPNRYESSGFQKRYFVYEPGTKRRSDEATSADLIELAARNALDDAALTPDSIDLFIAFTTTSPRYTSSVATLVAGRIGLRCAAFEMKSGCSSAVYALTIAYQFIAAGAKRVLIAGGDTLSKVVPVDSSQLYAAGDGGAAVIIGTVPEAERGLRAFCLDSDGSYANAMGVTGILPPIPGDRSQEYRMALSHDADDALREKWETIPRILYDESGLAPDAIDLYIPHQVNRTIMNLGCDAAGLDLSHAADYLSDYANCGPSGLLIALHRSRTEKRIEAGATVLLAAAGGGIAWGGIIATI